MKKYFIHTDSQPVGPFTVEELANMEITKYTPVWCEGLDGWTPAARVKELESLWSHDHSFVFNSTPPPAFDKDVYDQTLKDGAAVKAPAAAPGHSFGHPMFWIGLVVLVGALVAVVAYRYHARTMERAYAAALEQRRWEDSVNRLVDTARVPVADNDLGAAESVDATANAVDVSTMSRDNLKNYTRMNFDRFIRCTKSFDAKKLLGGIKNAKLTFYNNSEFTVDRAEFIVAYVKANGEVYNRSTVTIDRIPPHDKRELKLPDEKRGRDLQAMLTKVTSSELGLAKAMRFVF